MSTLVQLALLAALGGTLAACGSDGNTSTKLEGTEPLSFEEFASQVYREPWEGGIYICDGDTPAQSLEELRQVYEKSFTSRAAAVVDAMATATANWESYANVHFVYASDQDASCNSSNNNVIFDVNPVSGQEYYARAFFPSYSRSNRNIYVDDTAFSAPYPLYGIMMHELGHALGFRHEHTRPEGPANCFEDNSWHVVTPYDRLCDALSPVRRYQPLPAAAGGAVPVLQSAPNLRVSA